MRIDIKTNLTTKCFVIDYTESTKLMCRNSEEGLNLSAFRFNFHMPSIKFNFSKENTMSYRLMSYPAHLLLLLYFWRTSRRFLFTYSWFNLRATRNPWRPELGIGHRPRWIYMGSWRKLPFSFSSVVQLPSEEKLSIIFLLPSSPWTQTNVF